MLVGNSEDGVPRVTLRAKGAIRVKPSLTYAIMGASMHTRNANFAYWL